ncbi:MAG: ankyrin repeat domain-containing protein, partial (plasmid) [Candidatus Symbiodolus clandestinus]
MAKEVKLNLKDDLLLAKDKDGRTAWHWAAEDGTPETLEKLWEFSKEAKLNLKDDLLLTKDKDGRTAWHWAAESGIPETLEKLWEFSKEVKLNLKDDLLLTKDKDGRTALNCASNEKHWEIAVLLLNHGADINDLGAKQCNVLKAYIEQGSDANRQQLLEKIEQRLSLLPVESVREVAERAEEILEPIDVEEAGPSCGSRRRRRDVLGCGEGMEREGSVFPYEPLEEQVPIPQRHSARLYGQLALAVAWRQGMSLDNL